jgi:hypothetical protein
MNKKVVIFLSIIGVLVICGIVGILCYRNSPDYVMKQYIKAVNNKDQKILEKVLYTANQYSIENIEEAYGGMVSEISSYSIDGTSIINSSNIDKYKKVHFKYPERVDATITKAITYEIINKNGWKDWISLACINGKWKVVSCPLFYIND